MIFDAIPEGARTAGGPGWKKAFEFLLEAGPNAPEGKIELMGPDVTVAVVRTRTLEPGEAVLEAHREFADIHAVLAGEESIEWHPLAGLTVKTPYDPASDFMTFDPPPRPDARLWLRPGLFAAFFPQDAHRPKLKAGPEPIEIIKAVVKIRRGLW